MVKNPCNCFGTHGQFETQMWRHEMGMEGCNRVPSSSTQEDNGVLRQFSSGATRDTGEGKLDYEGFLSPLVLHVYAVHMKRHTKNSDGSARPSDNWQLGIPLEHYMKSGWRHFFDWWTNHRGVKLTRKERIITSICALLFNVMGYLHEYLKANPDALIAFEDEANYTGHNR